MNNLQTDNSYFEEKVKIRFFNLPNKQKIRVLDCYAGEGLIWERIRNLSDKEIVIIGIDKKKTKAADLIGDNIKFLGTIDLSNYDVINLDAYGVPYKQLRELFKRKESIKNKTIFITFIQSQYGRLPYGLLNDIGYSKKMIKKIPTLFNKNGIDKLKEYLAKNGVSSIILKTIKNKHYLKFELK